MSKYIVMKISVSIFIGWSGTYDGNGLRKEPKIFERRK
jgi:hypothetical protein